MQDDVVPRLAAESGWESLSGEDRLQAVCEVLREAIQRKKPVLVGSAGRPMIFCPQVLARRGEVPYVLGVVLLAEPALVIEQFDSPKRWRWMNVSTFDWALLKTGQFRTIPRREHPVLEGLEVDMRVAHPRDSDKAA